MKNILKKDLKLLKKWWFRVVLTLGFIVLLFNFFNSGAYVDYLDDQDGEKGILWSIYYHREGFVIFFGSIFFILIYFFTAWLYGDELIKEDNNPKERN
jgi:hypothetical protein